MTARRERAAAAVEPAPQPVDLGAEAPIAGEPVLMSGVVPSAAETKKDGQRAIGRTTIQVGVPGAIIGILAYGAAMAHWDLDPSGPGRDLPQDVTGYLLILLTALMAYAMNRDKLRATDDESAG